MAALGGDCPINEKISDDGMSSPRACYANRKITAYNDKRSPSPISGCNYRPGKGITGVMCCKRFLKMGEKNASTKSGIAKQPNDDQQGSSKLKINHKHLIINKTQTIINYNILIYHQKYNSIASDSHKSFFDSDSLK